MTIKSCSRRDFIKYGVAAGALTMTAPNHLALGNPVAFNPGDSGLVMVSGGEPEQLIQRMFQELGGIKKFISTGDKVFLKPNMSWDRPPECAANSNPQMVAAVVRECLDAGAKEVLIVDRTCNEPVRCYRNSGVEKYAAEAGAKVRHVMDSRFRNVTIPSGKAIKSWTFYKDVLDADVFINMPVAKHHGLSKVSLSLKNLMGLLGDNRGKIHNGFTEKIVDIASVLKPHLVILDAYRMLLANGPQGGNLQDVRTARTVIAGVNPISVDALGSTLFGLKPSSLAFLVEANRRGLGEISTDKLQVKNIRLTG